MRFRSPGLQVPMAACAAAVAMLAGAVPAAAVPARNTGTTAGSRVNYDWASAFAKTFSSPAVSPPGANDFSCQPSADHPYPVVLVHGLLENMNDNWQAASPILAGHGYCVFAFNYGGASSTSDFQATGDIATSAGQLAQFVNSVLAATGAAKVDIVGHSEGGLIPRYYVKFLGGAAKVDKLIGLAPPNHGTTIDGLVSLGQVIGTLAPINSLLGKICVSCVEMQVGQPFYTTLNSGGETMPGVQYTAIESTGDEFVTPYTSAFLSGPDVTNITLNSQCPEDMTDHMEISYDPVALADVLNALDPARPVSVPCLTVRPVTGPVGPVPPF